LRLRRWLIRLALLALLGPTLLVALYRFVDPPLTPLMLMRMTQGEPLHYQPVPLARVSPHLVRAVIASEDNLFCRHMGFDVGALRDQVSNWIEGERPRGASTITMQTAKNILLWPGRDPLRKILEAWLTPQLELLWDKPRILEVYLNVAEMGPGVYGAEAAARRFFGKPASALNRREAALLAAVLPNPRAWSAARPTPFVERRAIRITRRMDRLGALVECVAGRR
jgi:monofunctional glycosyltransferase